MPQQARRSAVRQVLGAGRAWLARGIGAFVAQFPQTEPAFIKLGRALLRYSYPLATLYFHANGNLIERLRLSGRRYRSVAFSRVTLQIDVTDHTGRSLYFHGTPYEPELTHWLLTELHAGDVFVDIGANIGFFSLVGAAVIGPTGRVVAFEPHPDARSEMVRLLQQNGVADRVDVVSAALGDRCEPAVPFYLTFDSVLSTLNPAQAPGSEAYCFDRIVNVPLTTLDRWMDGRPDLVQRIAAIKVDVEGLEAEVVLGMQRTLATIPRARLVVETTPDSDADRQLLSAGFVRSALDIYVSRGTFGNYLYQRESSAPSRA